MIELLRCITQICLLKQGPQAIPYSVGFMRLVIMLSILLDVFFASMQKPFTSAVLITAFGTIMTLASAHFLLLYFKKKERFVQLVSAVFATGILIDLIHAPIALQLANANDSGDMSVGLSLSLLALLAWRLAILTHIASHAAEISRGLAAFLVLNFWIFTVILSQSLIGN